MMVRSILIPACALLIMGGCVSETSHGYEGEFSVGVYSKHVASGWTLDLTHDIFWEGESSDTYLASCSITEGSAGRTLTFQALDTTFEQGFELTLILDPFDGDGIYEINSELVDDGFEMTLVTDEQTFDLNTNSGGICTVTISRNELFGDFTCPALEEYVLYVPSDLPFTITGNWECASLNTDG